jgi:hypothetical protein
MAARAAMEKKFMYSLSRVSDAFNGILPAIQKIWDSLITPLVAVGRRRFTTHLAADLAALAGKPRETAEKRVIATVKSRIGNTVQFRHDWIHNCSRPRGAIANWSYLGASVAVNEIKALVDIFETHIEAHRVA